MSVLAGGDANAVVPWATRYTDATVAQLRAEGYEIKHDTGTQDRDVQRAVLDDDATLVLVDADGGEVWSSELLYPKLMSPTGHVG
ncbi:hypothetical protein ACWCQ1_36240 [Streptomyces sp. NPDC002144]